MARNEAVIRMGRIKKRLTFLFVFFLIGSWTAASTGKSEKIAAPAETARINSDELFRRIADSSNQIKDLSAEVDFDLKLHNLGMNFNVSGDYYYKQPDKISFKFSHLPEFLSSRKDEIFTYAMLMSNLLRNPMKNFDGRVLAETPGFGAQCYLVELIPKTKQNITKVLLWVNTVNYTIPQTILEYDDGSNVTQKKTYTEAEHLHVVSKSETEIESPDVQADITASFKDYRINKGLPDTLFERTEARLP